MKSTAVANVVSTEVAVLQSLATQLGPEVEKCVELLRRTPGNILVVGMGTSGTVARRAAHLLACCGAPAFYVHPSDQQHGASGAIRSSDTVLVFSKGGESSEVNAFLRMARERGCRIVAVTGTKTSSMTSLVDAQIAVATPKEGEPFGMIATTSSLAACLVTDIICTLYLKAIGYTKERFLATHPGGAVGKAARYDE